MSTVPSCKNDRSSALDCTNSSWLTLPPTCMEPRACSIILELGSTPTTRVNGVSSRVAWPAGKHELQRPTNEYKNWQLVRLTNLSHTPDRLPYAICLCATCHGTGR